MPDKLIAQFNPRLLATAAVLLLLTVGLVLHFVHSSDLRSSEAEYTELNYSSFGDSEIMTNDPNMSTFESSIPVPSKQTNENWTINSAVTWMFTEGAIHELEPGTYRANETDIAIFTQERGVIARTVTLPDQGVPVFTVVVRNTGQHHIENEPYREDEPYAESDCGTSFGELRAREAETGSNSQKLKEVEVDSEWTKIRAPLTDFDAGKEIELSYSHLPHPDCHSPDELTEIRSFYLEKFTE